jgi:serine/threonine protein kinase
MDVKHSDRTRSIYLTAATLPPDEQERFVRGACGDDAALLRRISELLEAARESPAPAPPVIDGYRVIDQLGRGGMGTVWRAVQLGTRRRVALKLLPEEYVETDRAARRFEREVELAARLEHPNIARIYDAGLHERKFYYAMELVEGLPMDRFAQAHALDARQVVGLVRRACRAVTYAHARGVLHRDLKPSNILVTADAQPHVLDFGLAKRLRGAVSASAVSSAHTLTLHGEATGTPGYMSPEQASGVNELVDARTDVYALGAILYHLLTGDHPHELTNDFGAFARKLTIEEPRPPSSLRPGIDAELEAIVLHCVAREPENRYESARAFDDDLSAFLSGRPTSVRPSDPFGLREVGSPQGWRGVPERATVPAVVIASLACLAGATYGAADVENLLVSTLRTALVLACYGGVGFPLALRSIRAAVHRTGAFCRRDLTRRTFAAFLPTTALLALFWTRGASPVTTLAGGAVAAIAVTTGLLVALFRPHRQGLPTWLGCCLLSLAAVIPACAAGLWLADGLARLVLPVTR